MNTERSVADHYDRENLADLILDALRQAGHDLANLGVDDLAPLDHFHLRGRLATMELAALGQLASGQRVLDIGGGIGGPARTLAASLGCDVTVVDLTPSFLEAGRRLTRHVGLEGRVEFQLGNALELPFPDGSFDAVWTQHATMNIADKAGLYAEAARVLAPGGRLLFHEILAGPDGSPHFPVPWARDPSISFLLPEDEMRRTIAAAGLRELAWQNEREATLAWFAERSDAARSASGPPRPGVDVLLGPTAPTMFANVARNLTERRIDIVQGVFQRDGA